MELTIKELKILLKALTVCNNAFDQPHITNVDIPLSEAYEISDGLNSKLQKEITNIEGKKEDKVYEIILSSKDFKDRYTFKLFTHDSEIAIADAKKWKEKNGFAYYEVYENKVLINTNINTNYVKEPM